MDGACPRCRWKVYFHTDFLPDLLSGDMRRCHPFHLRQEGTEFLKRLKCSRRLMPGVFFVILHKNRCVICTKRQFLPFSEIFLKTAVFCKGAVIVHKVKMHPINWRSDMSNLDQIQKLLHQKADLQARAKESPPDSIHQIPFANRNSHPFPAGFLPCTLLVCFC